MVPPVALTQKCLQIVGGLPDNNQDHKNWVSDEIDDIKDSQKEGEPGSTPQQFLPVLTGQEGETWFRAYIKVPYPLSA